MWAHPLCEGAQSRRMGRKWRREDSEPVVYKYSTGSVGATVSLIWIGLLGRSGLTPKQHRDRTWKVQFLNHSRHDQDVCGLAIVVQVHCSSPRTGSGKLARKHKSNLTQARSERWLCLTQAGADGILTLIFFLVAISNQTISLVLFPAFRQAFCSGLP